MSNSPNDFMYNWIREKSGKVKPNVTTDETNISGSKDNKNETDTNHNHIQSNEYKDDSTN
jgi:hypothetical protein